MKNLRLLKEEPVFEDTKGNVLLGSSFETGPSLLRKRAVPKKLFKKGINEFIDFTDEEFAKYYLLPYDTLYGNVSIEEF